MDGRAGRFDRAIEQAKQGTSPAERLGGLLAVAVQFLDKNDTVRAQTLVEAVERELPSVPVDDKDECASSAAPPERSGPDWGKSSARRS